MKSDLEDCVGVNAQQTHQYWQCQLAGELPVLDFPADKAAVEKAPDIASHYFSIDALLTRALWEYSQQNQATLFTGVVTLITTLLHWYTRQQDIIVTTSFWTDDADEPSSFSGLPLRMSVQPSDAFTTVLGRVNEAVAQAARHRELNLETVATALQLNSDIVERSVLAVQLIYQSEIYARPAAAGNSALIVRVQEGAELAFTLEYDAARYSSTLIAQFGRHCQQLLGAVLTTPAQPIGQVELLLAPEKYQLLQAFNTSGISFSETGQTVVELFENQVRQYPDKVVLIFEGQELTYRELNARADQLAQRMLALVPIVKASEQNRLVAICLERGFNVYVAMLASLKSGAGYVPLDPHYPEERVDFMLRDTQVSLVLTETSMLAAKPYLAGDGRRLLMLDNEDTPTVATPLDLPRRVAGSDVAYVIYTSGSTGLPKGVLIEHDQIAATLLHMRHYYDLSAADTCVYYRSYCFDGSIEETLLPIISGARVIIVPTNTDEDLVAYLYRIIEQYRVTKINTPPAFLHLFLDRVESGAALHSLRHLVSGGDVLNKSLLGRLHASLTAKVHNTYGPTENTIDSTVFEVDRAAHYHTIPIGKPTANSSCYILNEYLQPVPLGVVGELCVGGTGVGRGYLNRPELTAARFIANPFATVADLGYANERLYKTGDLARWLPDGNIEFIGRIDNQVKIRGFRIELEEIESVLLKHPEIDSAVLVVKQFENSKELVAYLVSKVPQSAERLRDYLKTTMPDYMVPSYFVQLSEIPISTTGKVNKNVLPDPKTAALPSSQQHVGARNLHEEKLMAIWKEVLNRDTIGIKDDFINLGGTSLSAIRVIQRLRADGYKITTRDFLENLVLEEQAAILIIEDEQPPELVNEGTAIALSPMQQMALLQPSTAHMHAALVLQSQEALQEGTVTNIIEKLVSHHDLLRATFSQTDGKWQLYIVSSAKPTLTFFNYNSLSVAAADEQQRQEITAQQAALSLQQAAVKFLVFHRTEGSQLVIITHALLLDSGSWQVIVDDLVTLFKLAVQAKPLSLNSQNNGFQHWSEELVTYPASKEWVSEQAAWDAVDTACADVEAPTTYSELASIQRKLFDISKTVTRQAITEANQAFDTKTDQLVVSAFLKAVRKVLEIRTVPLTVTACTRDQWESNAGNKANTIGNFTCQYPLLLQAPGEEYWDEVLPYVRHMFNKVPNQGVGYGLRRKPDLGKTQPAASSRPPFHFTYQEAALTSYLPSSPFVAAQYQAATMGKPAAGLGISVTLLDDTLQVVFEYDSATYPEQIIDSLRYSFEAELLDAIAFCSNYSSTRGSLFKLSYNQQYYFRGGDLDQSRGLLPEFVIPAASVDLLQPLCTQLLSAVDILRVRFERRHGEVLQRVVPAMTVSPDIRQHKIEDARNMAAVEAVFQMELHQPFYFNDEQFVRFVLVHDEQIARCQIVIHHALTDGSSNQMIVELIHSLMQGDHSQLAHYIQVAPRYWDYIQWQRGFMRSKTAQRQLAYWTSNLAGFEQAAALPQAAGEEAQFDYLFKISQFIHGDSYERIIAFCKDYGIDLSSFFLASFALTLYAKNATDDLIIDTFSNGRDQIVPGVAMPELIGVILNKLPLKLRLNEQMSFGEVCKQVMEVYYEGRLHQQIPYIEMEKALGAACQYKLGDFEQVRFNYFDLSTSTFAEGTKGLTNQPKEVKLVGNNTALLGNYRLILDCKVYKNTVKLEWKYPCTEQFEGWEDTILPIMRLITESTQVPLARIRAKEASAAAPANSADDLVTITL